MSGVIAADSAENRVDERQASATAEPSEAGSAWWTGFARAVEDPEISTYEYLKDSIVRRLGLEGEGSFLGRAQRKIIGELWELTDVKELRKAVRRQERNALLFDARTRVALQCAGFLLETYIRAKEQYENDIARRVARGEAAPSAAENEAAIEKIIEQKLGDEQVARSVEKLACALTGKEREEVRHTIEEATRQLRDKSSLASMARDILGVSKKYFTLENASNFAIVALPLLTWQYRWAVALVLGAYVCRMACYHGARALYGMARGRWSEAAQEGHSALAALRAAGGNVLTIGISPLLGKLPVLAAGLVTLTAAYTYRALLDAGQYLLSRGRAVWEGGLWENCRMVAGAGGRFVKGFFVENQDRLVLLGAGAAKDSVHPEARTAFDQATRRVRFSQVRQAAAGTWEVGGALVRRFNSWAGELAAPDRPQCCGYSVGRSHFYAAAQAERKSSATVIAAAEPVAALQRFPGMAAAPG